MTVPVTPEEFIASLMSELTVLAMDERTVLARFSPGFVKGPRNGTVFVSFYNLPHARVQERRGGGAEAENNRMLFSVQGFSSDPELDAANLTATQQVNAFAPTRLRKKSGPAGKIASYLAKYINEAALAHPPNFTHE